MRLNAKELIADARVTAPTLPPAAAKLMTEMADRLDVQFAALCESREQVKQLAAENAAKQKFIATCFRAAGDGGDMDGNDIQELGERLGLFERQTYQPALHGYICGHEAGEDSVYVMKAAPATDAAIASLRADAIEFAAYHLPSNGKYEDMILTLADEVREGLIEVKIPALKYQSSQSEQVKGVQS